MRHEILTFEKMGAKFTSIVQISSIHGYNIFLDHGHRSSFVFSIDRDERRRWYYEIFSRDLQYLRAKKPQPISTRIYSNSAEIVQYEAERLLADFRENKLSQAFSEMTDETLIKLTIGTDAFAVIPSNPDVIFHSHFVENTMMINRYLDFEEIKKILDRENADHSTIGDRWIEYTFYLTFADFNKLASAASYNKLQIKSASH